VECAHADIRRLQWPRDNNAARFRCKSCLHLP
jgi:hypothetical protein